MSLARRDDRPLNGLKNIGPTIAARLAAADVKTVGDLKAIGPACSGTGRSSAIPISRKTAKPRPRYWRCDTNVTNQTLSRATLRVGADEWRS